MSWLKDKLGLGGKGKKLEPIVSVQIPDDTESEPLFEDQILRKRWAESLLADHSVPINPHLPCIESEAQVTIRSAQEIAERLRALTLVAVKGQGMPQDEVLRLADERGIRPLFSAKELAFIDEPDPSEHSLIQFVWRYEAAWVLFWALNLADKQLAYPGAICDVQRMVDRVNSSVDLTARAMQSANTILNEADLIYRYHWAVRQAQIDGKEPPANLLASVVMERHYALNWLIGYNGAEWDDVSTDT